MGQGYCWQSLQGDIQYFLPYCLQAVRIIVDPSCSCWVCGLPAAQEGPDLQGGFS